MVRCASLLLIFVASSGVTGCNVALGISDHEPIPPNCGVDSLVNTTTGFADVRTGHCYSIVKNSRDVTHPVAQNDCIVAGGYLACVTDKEEFDIINQHALHDERIWLGMRFGDGGVEGCDNAEIFDPTLPIWRDDQLPNNSCTELTRGAVNGSRCDWNDGEDYTGPDSWICEFEHGEPRE